jgi:hypothetical protein
MSAAVAIHMMARFTVKVNINLVGPGRAQCQGQRSDKSQEEATKIDS